jgi:hypothetical protein
LQRLGQALAQYPLAASAQLFSSLKKTGLEKAEAVILGWFDGRSEEKNAPG